MSWTYRYAPKIQPTQEFPDAALVEDDAETILDPVPKINAAPAHHAVFCQIGTVFNPGDNFGLLFLGQEWPGTGLGKVIQTRQAILIISKHPITKNLTVHGASFSSGLAGMTVQRHGDREHASRRPGILRSRGFRAQFHGRSIRPSDR
jgi:hypothetical protein